MATVSVQRLKRKLPDRIAKVRGDRSQRQFARDLGVFQQNVNRYESGTTPHTDFLITLALKEHVSVRRRKRLTGAPSKLSKPLLPLQPSDLSNSRSQ